jgi:hypothetical protein
MSENQRDPKDPGPGKLSFRVVGKGKDFLIDKEVGEPSEQLKERIVAAINNVLSRNVDPIQLNEVEYVRKRIPGKARGLDFTSVGEEHSLLSVKLSAKAEDRLWTWMPRSRMVRR